MKGERRDCITVLPAAEHPAPASVSRLSHEYALKDHLDGAWALRPLELVRERGQTALVLEYHGGEPLDRLLGLPMDTARFLRLAIALAAAVSRLHERGLVHKDIKPANIVVDAAGQQVWLTGFGVASRLPRERRSPEPPELIAGTLSHMAPEQTGRMNRSIDSRSDLYALGVTLYQALTGSLPFTASDPMEWVHCHVARKPVPPTVRLGDVPPQVSAIVMKLLAKTPEERYQTATGVERDLRRCLDEWDTRHSIGEFTLGEHDTPDRLLIPEKLYGRSREIGALLAAFDDVVASGAPRLVLVSGHPGIGKSSVVNELHKALVPSRGLFASGKFDQLKRDTPYATLAQAFQSLVRHLLGMPEAQLSRWRDELRQALDPNGALVVELVPELEFVIGEPPPLVDLPPANAKRLQLALRRLIGVFARADHPLALFLDDLQWLDGATLDLLEDLLVQPDKQHLLLVGAYRDNEVDAVHPLTRSLEAIRESGAEVQQIALAPLSHDDLGQLVADALLCERQHGMSLAKLVHQKTAGNPFFASQFMHALAEEGAIAFDFGASRWSWDMRQLQGMAYARNVADLMVGKLSRLPQATRTALEELACLGNVAGTSILALVHGSSKEELHADLWEALRLELVVQSEDSYRFVHDRVQEAAYSLIPMERRAQAHLRIGRLLRDARGQATFDIVGQLNRGSSLLTSQDERDELAELNLDAGKRAHAAGALASALTYLTAGAALLGDDGWLRRHDLRFELELSRAECEYQTGDGTAAEERFVALSLRAANLVERAKAVFSLAAVHFGLGQTDRSITECLSCLRDAGLDIPLHPTNEQAQAALDRIRAKLVGRSIEELAQLPPMTDPAARAAMDLLAGMLPSAMHTDKNLMGVVVCAAIELSLEQGHCDVSSYVYVYVAALPGWPSSHFETGLAFGRLGQALAERKGYERIRVNVCFAFAMRILPWAQHVADCRDLIRRAFDLADQSGDRNMAASCSCALVSNLLVAGEPLAEVEKEAEFALEICRRSTWTQAIELASMHAAFIRNLRGVTPRFGAFADERYDEQSMQQGLANHKVMPFSAFAYWVRTLQARLLAGDWAGALEASSQAQPLMSVLPAVIEMAEHAFYSALAHAAACDSVSADERPQHVQALSEHHRQIEEWSGHCPENFKNRAALLAAEIARIEGRDPDAMRLYDRAIGSARENGFVHNEALATELAARFYAARGFDRIAKAYMRDARHGYRQWGADGKVRQLDDRYPYLRDDDARPDPTRTVQTPVEHLDLSTVLKVSQAVTAETDLDKLIAMIMRLALEHAGAERGLLILPQGDAYRIEAEARIGSDAVTVALRESDITPADLPQSVFHYVVRTRESVLLNDASADKPFSDDEYLRRHRAHSVVCLPLLKQTRLVGVIYLENNLTPGAFTPARMALLKLLASDAAISLENARLYRDLQEREARVRRLVDSNIIGIVIWHADGRVVDTNEAFLRITGHDREELLSGRVRWTDLTPPDARLVDQVRDAGAVQPHERELFRKGGSRVSVLVGGALFDGVRDEGVAFVLDLTELKRAEQAARDSERRYHEVQIRLSDANRVASIGQLSASIAHEINQPLSGIVTNAGTCLRMLDADPPNVEGARETARRTLRDGSRASDVIARLRALFGKREFALESMDLNEVMREVLALSSGELQRNRVIVQPELAGNLPSVSGDRIQLQQVIVNLLRNASEAMASVDDRPRRLVITTEREADDRVRVAVRDVGVGLDRQHLDNLFDAFYTTKSGGMGIGLSVSRSIIERHHGRLWAEPNEDAGATFWFSIPCEPEQAV
ncbi:ATP-binding sensor histidine kinase [Piscinibacter sp. XHJ-5]|uniref:trifunctional serine/threonine-protein kinase/ATP-binding protein/sensor histidine kinase n=1 Tax=Piscinibacter sp. XHJ-5 TaxID=3037797 RepID=UPI002452D73D|nr:ATP-binding sensor histidine kinase [Piscinibacter sp. XHJ-5]